MILGNDFGPKAGLILDLTEQRVYFKDTCLLMSALDQPYHPDVSNAIDNGASTPKPSQLTGE